MILMMNVGSTLNRAALGRPAPRAIQVVSYTEDYVISSYPLHDDGGNYQVDRRSNHGKRHCP
jgi:hypothetical protein